MFKNLLSELVFYFNKPAFPVHKKPGGYQAWRDRKEPHKPSWLPLLMMMALFGFCGLIACGGSTGAAAYFMNNRAATKATALAATILAAEATTEATAELTAEATIEAAAELTAEATTEATVELTAEPTATITIRQVELLTPTLLPEATIALPTATDFPTRQAQPQTVYITAAPQIIYVRQTAKPEVKVIEVTAVIIHTSAPQIVTATYTASATMTSSPTATYTASATYTPTDLPTATYTATPTETATELLPDLPIATEEMLQ